MKANLTCIFAHAGGAVGGGIAAVLFCLFAIAVWWRRRPHMDVHNEKILVSWIALHFP